MLNKKRLLIIIGVFSISCVFSLHFVFCVNSHYEILVYNLTIDCTNCTEINPEQLLAYAGNNKFDNGVPRIIHYDYKSRMLPSQYVPLVKTCIELNPGVKFVLWSDSTSYQFVRIYFSEYFSIFESYFRSNAEPLKKSDLIRYFILEYFGGVYMDLDTKCQKPIEVAMKEDSCVLSREAEVQSRILWNYEFLAMNSFMACVPNHTFFRHLLNNLIVDNHKNILTLTGPLLLTDVFIKYNTSMNDTDRTDPLKYVTVSTSDEFSPLVENYTLSMCKTQKGKWSIMGCRDIDAYMRTMMKRVLNAVVVHLFLHLGYENNWGKIKSLYDAGEIRGLEIMS